MTAGPVTGIDWTDQLKSGRALDPYLIWADFTCFATSGGVDREAALPFLIEATAGSLTGAGLPPPLNRVEVAPAYRSAASLQPTRNAFFTARVALGDIADMLKAASTIPRFQLSLARSGAQTPGPNGGPAQPAKALRQPEAVSGEPVVRTVVGIIDDGCPFAHPNLADPAGRPRVRHLWDQGATAVGGAAPSPWQPVPELQRGAEVDARTLARYSATFGERGVYPALGNDRITGRSRTHGNGICHLAAGTRVPVDLGGRQVARDAASELPIVFVQLPWRTVADTSGGSIGFHVLDALHYIQARANSLVDGSPGEASAPQVVVNLSYGSVAGPHDGTSLTERALVDFLQRHDKVSLVVAAGNANREPLHVQFALASGARHVIEWAVGPDHPVESYLEIWWPHDADLGQVEVQLRAPGDAQPTVVARFAGMAFDRPVDARCGVIFCGQVAQGGRGTMTLLAVRATRGESAARPGHWQVTAVNRGGSAIAEVHAWVERNDLMLGRRRPQQALLMTAGAQRSGKANMALASMSNVVPQTAFGVSYTVRYLVAGASRLSDQQRAEYSSTGPSRGLMRLGPDGLAPADLSPAQPGLLVDGPFDGKWARASGSSAAAAVVTRKLAGDFEQLARAQARPPLTALDPSPRRRGRPGDALPVPTPPTPAATPTAAPDGQMALKVITFDAAGEDGWFRIEPAMLQASRQYIRPRLI